MKPRSILIVTGLILTAAFCALCLSPVTATETRGRDTMTLDGGKSGPVQFNHHLHQDLIQDCQACHKDFKQERGSLDAAKAAGVLQKKQVMNKTCIACHREKKKAGENAGPVTCKDCHSK